MNKLRSAQDLKDFAARGVAAQRAVDQAILGAVLPPENYLEVGHTEDMREIVINHPNLMVDRNGAGHIVFSPAQARALARLLLRKADECKP